MGGRKCALTVKKLQERLPIAPKWGSIRKKRESGKKAGKIK